MFISRRHETEVPDHPTFSATCGRRWVLLWIVLALLTGKAAHAQTSIAIDGSGAGRVFEGVGGVSAGGASRLLKDYPEPYRSQILDYLFEPNFGASLQDLKVEIGGDENSGDGAEPTHMRSATDQNYTRGYEFWLMQQAKSRNPGITLNALEWGAPGWIGGGQFYSQDNINYLLNFLNGAETTYGLTIDYVGIWNETPYDTTWIKNLKSALQANGLTTKIVAADECCGNQWNIANDMLADGGLMAAVDAIGAHYPSASSSSAAQGIGKPLWDSEDGGGRADWVGAQAIAQTLLGNYPGGKMTKTELWALVSSYYDISTLRDSGLMLANTPWSGSFTVEPAIWAVAHVTQFAQPGWRYIDSACGVLSGESGSYITLQAPNGTDYSTILQTTGAPGSQTVTFTIRNGLNAGPVHVWMSNAATQFVQESDITPAGESFSITLAPDSIYSLTTTTGQSKGSVSPPASSAFPFPYSDAFEQYSIGATPLYFSDFTGAFETANCGGSRSGLCLSQAITASPIPWLGAATGEPETFIGDATWTNYQESVDALFQQPGSTVKLYGRLSSIRQADGYLFGYQLDYDTTGNWSLSAANQVLISGTTAAPGINTWHTLKLIFSGASIQGVIDGITVASLFDTTFTAGLGGLGTSWANAQFDNFIVDFVPGTVPVSVLPPIVTLGASEAQQFAASVAAGNNQVTWSITPSLGSISTGGLYSAPPFVAATKTVTVTATSVANTTQSGTATVTLEPVGVSVNPFTVVLGSGQTQQFSATVTGSGNTGVTWSISPPVGTISSSGSYTAPTAVTATQNITVTATSVADTTKSGTAVVMLVPPQPPAITQEPSSVTVAAGQTATFSVTALGGGLSYQWQSMPAGAAGFSPIPGATSSSYTTTATVVANSGTQLQCVVSNGSGSATSSVAVLTVVSGTAFVLSSPTGTLRNNFTGWVGLTMTVGNSALTVTAVGRICVAGNSGIHSAKFVNAGTGTDVPGGSASVNMLGCTAGQFVYAPLPGPIKLSANASYYLASQEINAGDLWYDFGAISSTSDAVVNSSIYSGDSLSWVPEGTGKTSYVPPNFLYSTNSVPQYLLSTSVSPTGGGNVGASPSSPTGYYNSGTQVQLTATPQVGCTFTNWTGGLTGSANPQTVTMSGAVAATANFQCTGPPPINFLTAYALNAPALRNNFSGWVGMKVTVGTSPLIVSAVGRICVAGNSSSHIVKFVSASSGTDVPGGSATVNLSGCTAGQFAYASLASPISLQANTAYYVASQEVSGGDRWYDFGLVSSTSDAFVNNSIYSFDSVSWIPVGAANTSYVPPNFSYTLGQASPPIAVTVQANPSAASFSVDGTSYSGSQVFSWAAGSAHTIAATSSQSAGTGTQYAWSSWSDGGGISHTVSPTSATTFTANFETQYLLSAVVSPAKGEGVVANPSSATGYYDSGAQVQLTAMPNASCTFTNWSGGLSGSLNPQTVTLSGPIAVTANFQCSGPAATDFLTGFGLNTPPLRNNFSGWVGMRVTPGANPLSVSSVGRICVAGNSGSHTVKFVSASTGTDVPGGSATVKLSGCTAGQFVYASLANPVTLQSNSTYYVASQELNGGDRWYDFGAISSTNDAAVNSSIYSSDGVTWIPVGPANTSYVPVDFQYSLAAPDPTFVTGYNLNSRALRNNYSGWVGMKFTVGTSAMEVNSLGRIFIAGNGGVHTVKLVHATDGTDVAGASVSVSMGGGTAGQFSYTALASPVVLPANTSYYLVSQESAGGDQWYDYGTVSTTSAGAVTSAVYSSDSVNWILIGAANSSYVPPNLK